MSDFSRLPGDPLPTRIEQASHFDRVREAPVDRRFVDLHPSASTSDSSEIDLNDVLKVLRHRAGLIAGVVAASLAIAMLVIWFREPVYRATAVVRLADTRQQLAGALGGVTPVGLGQPDPLLSQIEILRSASVLGVVVDEQGLRFQPVSRGLLPRDFSDIEVPPNAPVDELTLAFAEQGIRVSGAVGELQAGYGEQIDLDGLRFVVPVRPAVNEGTVAIQRRSEAIETLREDLNARLRPETDVVDIQYSSRDPETASRIANALVSAFQRQNATSSRQEAQRRRAFVEDQLGQAEETLSRAQDALSAFRRREGVFSSSQWFAAQQAGLLTLEVQREELGASNAMYRSLLEGIKDAEPGEVGTRLQAVVASPEVAVNPIVVDLFAQLARYEAARDSLVSGPWRASESNPDLRRIEAQIETTVFRLESAVDGHLKSLDARIAALDDLQGRTESGIRELPSVETEESRLVQEMEAVLRSVELLREEHQRARIAEAVDAGQVEIVDPADIPIEPIGSGRAVTLLLALVLGLFAGTGSAFLVENMNTRILRREEMETALQTVTLGVIPRLPEIGTPSARIETLAHGDPVRAMAARTGLVTLADGPTPQAEAFRSIRTNLLFADAYRSMRTLVITSSTPSEGKTTTAANLAVACAQQGIRVLLVDCDLRRARVHQMFDLPRRPGLTELLLGQASWEEARNVSPVETLHLLTSGAYPPNPSELLGGARMRKGLELLTRYYDLVILDSPPLVAGPDAAVLSSYCDGVALVVRAGTTEREVAEQAVRQLHAVGAHLVGAILNDPDGVLPRFSSYYAYQYRYYSEEQD